jgi:putative transposase
MTIEKGFHCAYDTHYHIVFPVKYRKALLSPEIAQFIKATALEIAQRYDLAVEQMGTDGDHIHLLLSFHPKYSIGQVVRLFKSITARRLFQQFPELKRELWGGEFWTDGYYVATVGTGGNWTVVEAYVKNQGRQTKTPSAQTTLW